MQHVGGKLLEYAKENIRGYQDLNSIANLRLGIEFEKSKRILVG